MSFVKKPLTVLLLSLLLVNVIQNMGLQLDVTSDQRYSLSEATLTKLKNLKKPLRIDVFLTGNVPDLYRDYRSELDVFLNQLNYYSDALLIQYNDPFELGSTEQVLKEMEQYGMPPEIVIENNEGQRKQNLVFPWMIVNYEERSERIYLLDKQLGDTEGEKISRSIQQMEFLIMDGIEKVTLDRKGQIAFLTSHRTSPNSKTADLRQSLSPYYNLVPFDLKNDELSPLQKLKNLDQYDALIISNPNEPFSQTEKYILDQYSLKERGILWLVNGVGINRDSLFNEGGRAYGFPLELNLNDYFFKQGIRINNTLVQDLYCAPIVLASGYENNTQYLPYPWPYYPLPKPESNLIGQDMGPIFTRFASSIDTLKSALEKQVLLQTSPYTQTSGIPILLSLEQATKKIQPNLFTESSKILGLALKGPQKSLFENRIKPFENENHIEQGQLSTIVFSDGNVAENQTDKGAPLQLGYDKWTNNFYANKQLLLNAIHYLNGNLEGLTTRQKKWKFNYLDSQKIATRAMVLKLSLLFSSILIPFIFGVFNQRGRSKHLTG